MTIETLRVLFDFGLLILIWIVQLVVYPSFKYYQQDRLLEWHKKYTGQITYIVLPLMLGQLLISGIQLWNALNWYSGISFLIIVLLWGSTFLQFVPMHNKISKGVFNQKTLEQLVLRNWLRTFLWTTLFCLSFAKLLLGSGAG